MLEAHLHMVYLKFYVRRRHSPSDVVGYLASSGHSTTQRARADGQTFVWIADGMGPFAMHNPEKFVQVDYARQLHSGSSRALCHAEERVRAHVQSVSVCPLWKPGTTEKVQLTVEATTREHPMENNMETEL